MLEKIDQLRAKQQQEAATAAIGDATHNMYEQSEIQSMRLSSGSRLILGSIYGDGYQDQHQQQHLSSLAFFKVEVFEFQVQSNFKQYITFDRGLQTYCDNYTMMNAFDDRKYKLFNPLIFDPPKLFREYKQGNNWVIATKISIQKYLNQMTNEEVQEEVK